VAPGGRAARADPPADLRTARAETRAIGRDRHTTMTTERHAATTRPNGRGKGFLLKDRFIPRPERVFTNRNLRLSSVQAIGFDLDHTLAHYDALAVERLAFEVTKRKLVEQRGYPEETCACATTPTSCARAAGGQAAGNILKLDTFKYVTRAYHGRRRLPGTSDARSTACARRGCRPTPTPR